MVQHRHITVTSGSSSTTLADWLVESEGQPQDADLLKAAQELNLDTGSPLKFSSQLMNHTGEYPGPVRYDNQRGLKVWVFPASSASQ
jgi:hypothetical protein